MTPESQIRPETMDINGQLRQFIMGIGQLAQQAPEIQQELQAAAKALTMGQMKLMASQPDAMGNPQPVIAA